MNTYRVIEYPGHIYETLLFSGSLQKCCKYTAQHYTAHDYIINTVDIVKLGDKAKSCYPAFTNEYGEYFEASPRITLTV